MFKFGIARKIATSDWIVLLYTTGLYCLKSSDVKPLSWIILKAIKIIRRRDQELLRNMWNSLHLLDNCAFA